MSGKAAQKRASAGDGAIPLSSSGSQAVKLCLVFVTLPCAESAFCSSRAPNAWAVATY